MAFRSLILGFLLFSLNYTFGISWLSGLKIRDTLKDLGSSESEQKLGVLGLPGDFLDEIDDLESKSSVNLEALRAYSSKSDCFKTASNRIVRKCQELELDEDARVNGAIVMTMCEISTGQQYSLPLECKPYFPDKDPIMVNMQTRSKCVDALARSPQFWSSYSGYLREIPQLCHAYRRWNDIDLARNIYYNITLEKINFLRLIFGHEKKSERRLQDLILQAETLLDAVRTMENYVKVQDSSVEHLMAEFESGFHHAIDVFRTRVSQNLESREKAEVISLAKFEATLKDTLVTSSAHLNSFVDSIGNIIRTHVDELVVSHKSYYGLLFRDLITTRNGFMEFHQSFVMLKQEVESLQREVITISDVIIATLQDASRLQTYQDDMSRSTVAHFGTLKNLTDATHMELSKINTSAIEVRRNLLLKEYPLVGWGPLALQIFSVFGKRYDISTFQTLASFRFLAWVLTSLWVVVRYLISSMLGIAMSLLLARTHFSKVLRPLHWVPDHSVAKNESERRLNYISRIPRRLYESESYCLN